MSPLAPSERPADAGRLPPPVNGQTESLPFLVRAATACSPILSVEGTAVIVGDNSGGGRAVDGAEAQAVVASARVRYDAALMDGVPELRVISAYRYRGGQHFCRSSYFAWYRGLQRAGRPYGLDGRTCGVADAGYS